MSRKQLRYVILKGTLDTYLSERTLLSRKDTLWLFREGFGDVIPKDLWIPHKVYVFKTCIIAGLPLPDGLEILEGEIDMKWINSRSTFYHGDTARLVLLVPRVHWLLNDFYPEQATHIEMGEILRRYPNYALSMLQKLGHMTSDATLAVLLAHAGHHPHKYDHEVP